MPPPPKKINQVNFLLSKNGGGILVNKMTPLFSAMWNREDVPADWSQGVIVPVPKKESLSDCNNWRGITLVSVPGKVFCSVLLNTCRLKNEVDNPLREEQTGFRKGRLCSEQILTLRNIIEQCYN